MQTIYDQDISVVIQGRVSEEIDIASLVAAYANYLPNSQIILSTWKTDAKNVPPNLNCKIILNDDPGFIIDSHKYVSNLNRQIVTTSAGIAVADRIYVLKTRTDIPPTSNLKSFCSKRPGTAISPALLKNKIRITNLFVRNPILMPYLFHPSDIVMFGLRADLAEFWCVELAPPCDIVTDPEPFEKNGVTAYKGKGRFKLVPEQWLMLSLMKRKGFALRLSKPMAVTPTLLSTYLKFLYANFELVEHAQAGFAFPSRFTDNPSDYLTLMPASEFERIPALKNHSFYRACFFAVINRSRYLHSHYPKVVSKFLIYMFLGRERGHELVQRLKKIWIF